MKKAVLILAMCMAVSAVPAMSGAGSDNPSSSSYWSNLVHQENSITASLLYLPYVALQIPIGLIEGVLYPTPVTQATVPPPAHKAPR